MPSRTQPPSVRPRASAMQARTTDQRAITRVQPPPGDYDEEYDDVWPPRQPTSVRRYQPPPAAEPVPQRRSLGMGWYLAVVLSCICIGVALAIIIPPAWQNWRDSSTYGYPRTFQTDASVGHGDPHSPSSHFIALNNRGVLEVIELPGGDPATYPPRLYRIASLTGPGADQVVLTVSFADMSGNGKLDLIANYNGTAVILWNDGKTFVSKL